MKGVVAERSSLGGGIGEVALVNLLLGVMSTSISALPLYEG